MFVVCVWEMLRDWRSREDNTNVRLWICVRWDWSFRVPKQPAMMQPILRTMSSSSDRNGAIGSAAATGIGASSKTNNMAQEEKDNRILEDSLSLARIQAALRCKRLQERSTELEREVERKYARSQRFLKQAHHVAVKAVQVKDDAADAEKLEKSLTLQSILLRLQRNDANTIELSGQALPSGYGEAIGKALRQNTIVTKLDLSFPSCLSSPSGRGAEEEMKSLFNFVAKNQLVDFAVYLEKEARQDDEFYRYQTISHELLKAVSKCARLGRLSWCFPVAATTFSSAMANVAALRDLQVRFLHANLLSEDARRTIAASFQSANTLEKLKLWVGDNADLSTRILLNVADTRPPLQELTVVDSTSATSDVIRALCQVLSSASTIERFEMEGFEMNEDATTRVLAALQLQTVSKLSFRECTVLEVGLLASMLKTRTGGSDGAIVVNSNLRELHVSESEDPDSTDTNSEYVANSILADSILAEKQVVGTGDDANAQSLPVYLPTIGSQIECLSLGYVESAFFDTLRDNADRVRLQRLELIGLTKHTCIAFRRCIPYLTTIRSFKAAKVAPDGLDWVLQGLKNNGSICDVVATGDDDATSNFSLSQLRLMDAYCQRNRLLNKLIESGPSPGDKNNDHTSSSGDGGGATADSDTSMVVDSEAHLAELVVRPPLLQAAQQVPNSCLTVVIRGLLALNESITKE